MYRDDTFIHFSYVWTQPEDYRSGGHRRVVRDVPFFETPVASCSSLSMLINPISRCEYLPLYPTFSLIQCTRLTPRVSSISIVFILLSYIGIQQTPSRFLSDGQFGIPGQQRIVQGIVRGHASNLIATTCHCTESSPFEWIEDYCVTAISRASRRKGYVKRTETKEREYRFGKYRLNVDYALSTATRFIVRAMVIVVT